MLDSADAGHTAMDASTRADTGVRPPPTSEGACGCRVGRSDARSGVLAALGLMALAAVARRRRARR